MAKFFKITLIFILSLMILAFSALLLIFAIPPKVQFSESKLKKQENSVILYDKNKKEISVSSLNHLSNKEKDISQLTKKAFISIEDKNFYTHNGIDVKRIFGALIKNVKSKSYKQGASTISQQLIKNTHLSSEKTLSRKIDEIKLARILEKKYSKDEILNMYLNTIYFGENAYGIEQAAYTYFSKNASDLNLNESATLAGLIVAPSKLNPKVNLAECKKRRNLVLSKMREQNYIDNETEKTVKNEDIPLNYNDNYVTDKSFINATLNEFLKLREEKPYTFKNCKIYTEFDPDLQDILIKSMPNIDTDFQAMVLNNQSRLVSGYYSTCGEIKRSPASTAKPYVAYAPSIEEGLINEYTKILDEKTNFNGYCPSNYKDKYYGNVSAKEALSRSLNVASVKVLNTIGTEKAKNYAKMLDIDIKSDDLGIALGAFENDISLLQSAGAYATFANLGEYKKPQYISYIEDFNGNILYRNNKTTKQVFSKGTSSIICDMLRETVLSGTAKTLRTLDFDVYSKTGTNGLDNGNLDAYNLSFTKDKTFAVWVGNSDNSLMDNSITGSSYPTSTAYEIISSVYKNKKPEKIQFDGIKTYTLDKKAYDDNGEILLASENTPKKYTFNGIFNDKNYPKNISTTFSKPKIIDYSLNFENNQVNIKYRLDDIYKVEIIKLENGIESVIYDGNNEYFEELTSNSEVKYYLQPYVDGIDGKVYGEKVYLGKINPKLDEFFDFPTIPRDWWRN